ncbi:MAG: hypothetical protein DRJ52_08405 [Thermoprotei archaeon]|nr:MAG: hypothetical protein DRJ52_08405 [Thermoprotei archaeon]
MLSEITYSNPFSEKGQWFKGNLHTHSTYSDGLLTPKQLAYLYRNNGYSFLAITDHNKVADVRKLSTEDFLVLPGIEVDTGKGVLGSKYHIVGVDIEEEIKAESAQEAIDKIVELGGVAIVAHPYWSSLTLNDLLKLEKYLGIEVFNTTCEVDVLRGYSVVHWDMLLTAGRRVYGFAVDDAHWSFRQYKPVDACKAWIMVKAEELSREAIIKSIKKGLFYSSTGPVIKNLEIKNGKVVVECSPVKVIAFVVDHARGCVYFSQKNDLTRAEYRIRGNEIYIRIECKDSEGNTAWTNPIFIK